MATWDIAAKGFDCFKCHDLVGQGEAFRVSKVPGRGYCEDCSVKIDGATCPEHLRPRSFLERMQDDISQAAPKGSSFASFEEFNPAELPAGLRRELQSKATAASVRHVARKPGVDPRGQRRSSQRHGVVQAMRETDETDWRARRAGDRE